MSARVGAVAALVVVIVLSGLLGHLATRLHTGAAPLLAARVHLAHTLAASAIDTARARGALWLNTENLLRRAARSADPARALSLLRQARDEARLAVNQSRLERARYFLTFAGRTLPPAQASHLAAVIRRHDGVAALALARRYGASLSP